MSAFPPAEYRERLARVRRRMVEQGLDVLVCADPASLNYLTGYDGWSFYVPQVVAVPLGAEDPVWIGREMDVAGARLTSILPAVRLHGYPDGYLDAPDCHPMQFVASVLRGLGWGRGRIGVEMDAWYFTARAHAELVAALPGASVGDARALVSWARLVKSPAELAMMRAAAAIVGRAMRAGIEAVAPGVRECDVAARVLAALAEGTPEHAGDYPAALPSVPGGVRTAAPHLTWSGERYSRDSVAYLELAGCHQRYHAPLARTVCLGTPAPGLRDLAATVADGLEAALDAARPGRTCEEVEAAWRVVAARAGLEKRSRIGYAVGLGYPPDWGERTASLRPGDRTVLAPGMCFHLILGIWMDDRGYELSETFRVSEAGAPEVLTQFPRDLVVKA
jgi:Xaa-Pro dipeptidase